MGEHRDGNPGGNRDGMRKASGGGQNRRGGSDGEKRERKRSGGRKGDAEFADIPENSYDTVKPAPGFDDRVPDPFEIDFLPEHRGGVRGPEKPFVNDYGVVIGDHEYASPDSPLERWSRDTEPAIMAGEQWVHPYKDIGFRTSENRDLFEKGIPPSGGMFMHPVRQTARPEGAKNDPRRESTKAGDGAGDAGTDNAGPG